MSVEIYHKDPGCAYTIREYNKNIITRYIVLEVQEMEQLSKLLKGLGF